MLPRSIKIGGILALVVIGGAAVLVASRWPFTRDTIVRALEKRFSSTVELKTFHGTYFTPGCVAEGVTLRRNGDRNAPPIATIEKLTIQGSYWGFFTTPKRVPRVRVEGLRIFVSPRSERIGNEARPTGSLAQSAVIIDEIIADGAVVKFASGEPGREPLKFEIHKLSAELCGRRPANVVPRHARRIRSLPEKFARTGNSAPCGRRTSARSLFPAPMCFNTLTWAYFPG